MTRGEILDLAKLGVGYSYWWGHGAWRDDGTQLGSCSGSCPDCTHTGSYGADCSGFAAKVWQVPSPSPITADSHPYSTYNFRYETTHWEQISRDTIKQADCLVYNSDGSGHIVVYESGDPWGSLWTYECKGCSYGCVHNLRTVSSSYIAIRRNNITETVATGTLQGVVYAGSNTDDRIPGAEVVLNTGERTIADQAAAYFSFDLPPGTYTVTATAPGYFPRSRVCSVTVGGSTWCSIGLSATCTPDCSERECGPDPVCGTSCGSCPAGLTCTLAGTCQASCTPDCAGRECGPDPVCGTSCGTCPQGLACNPLWRCEQPTCVPDCTARWCGVDPICGQSCGVCAADKVCDASTGACVAIDPSRGKLYGYALVLLGGDPPSYQHVAVATITADTGEKIVTDADGYYELLVVPGTRTLTVTAEGMVPGTHACTVAAGSHTACHLSLLPFSDDGEGDARMLFASCGAAKHHKTHKPGGLLLVLLAMLFPIGRRRHRSARTGT